MQVSPKALQALLVAPAVVAALSVPSKRAETPAGKVDPGTASDCTYWAEVDVAPVTCESLQSEWFFDLKDFQEWNPLVKSDCSGMTIGNSYCVEVNYGLPRSTSTTSEMPITTTTTSTTSDGTSTPSPTQPGMVKDCTKFYFVKKDDTCDDIASKNGISSAEFAMWNPKVGDNCGGLWADSYACVDVAGRVITTTTTTSTTTTTPAPTVPSNGIQTPLPTQPGMVTNCVKFHYVSKGDVCDQITSYQGISRENFVKWNPGVGKNCESMWAENYACVGIAGFSLKTRYNTNCGGAVHNNVAIKMGQGYCMNTGCQVGSLEIDAGGACPDGQVQLSYWENEGCSGRWFGYGYSSKGTCRGLWTNGWKFKAIHLRCAKQEDDCSSKGSCKYDDEPKESLC